MGAPIVRFEIIGGNGNQLEKFYGELFGWKIDSNNPMKYGLVDTGGGPGGINGGVFANWRSRTNKRCRPTKIQLDQNYRSEFRRCLYLIF